MLLEPLWPSFRESLDQIRDNINSHKGMMTTNVTLEEISQAKIARKRALEEYDDAKKFRDNQTFNTIRTELRPETYDTQLLDILQFTSSGSGQWLNKEENFMRWLDPLDRTLRFLWLQGIPGAGMHPFHKSQHPTKFWLADMLPTENRQDLPDRQHHPATAEVWTASLLRVYETWRRSCRKDFECATLPSLSSFGDKP